MDIKLLFKISKRHSEKMLNCLLFSGTRTSKGETEKISSCFFKGMKTVRDGGIISLNAENIGCGGGKFILASPKCQNVH